MSASHDPIDERWRVWSTAAVAAAIVVAATLGFIIVPVVPVTTVPLAMTTPLPVLLVSIGLGIGLGTMPGAPRRGLGISGKNFLVIVLITRLSS